MPLAALVVSLAALAVAAAALVVGWRAVRVLDLIAARLAERGGAPPVGAPADATEAEPPDDRELRLLVERAAGRQPVLVVRNDGSAPVEELMVALDGWFAGAMGGPYENDPPPSRLAAGGSWRCPIVTEPAPGHRLHLLLRWSRDGVLERRELELPC